MCAICNDHTCHSRDYDLGKVNYFSTWDDFVSWCKIHLTQKPTLTKAFDNRQSLSESLKHDISKGHQIDFYPGIEINKHDPKQSVAEY